MLTYKEFLNEAIKLSQYRDYKKGLDYTVKLLNKEEFGKLVKPQLNQKYDKWFGKEQRIYLPLVSKDIDPIYKEVQNEISKSGYDIDSWKDGLAKKKDSNRTIRIGKLLADNQKLLKDFNERFKGKKPEEEKEYEIVISRHLYDILGQSEDRKWTSCKSLSDGENKHFIISEFEEGLLIAYVIEKGDKNIKNPVARLLIVPYVNANNTKDIFMYVPDRVYGDYVTGFRETVQKWLDDKQGKKIGLYCLSTKNRRIYDDKFPSSINKDTGEESLSDNAEIIQLKMGTIYIIKDTVPIDYSPDYLQRRFHITKDDSYPLSNFIEEILLIPTYDLVQKLLNGEAKQTFIDTAKYLMDNYEDEDKTYYNYYKRMVRLLEKDIWKITYRLG